MIEPNEPFIPEDAQKETGRRFLEAGRAYCASMGEVGDVNNSAWVMTKKGEIVVYFKPHLKDKVNEFIKSLKDET